MKHVLSVLALWATVLSGQSFKGKVVGIIDGDTLSVLRNNFPQRVRLYGIDSPETKQPFGTKAKQWTGERAFGKVVTVNDHGNDLYGRTIGEIILPNGKNLNRELVKAGFAWWYKSYAPKDTELQVLEIDARKSRRGLWADTEPIAPWEWRKTKR